MDIRMAAGAVAELYPRENLELYPVLFRDCMTFDAGEILVLSGQPVARIVVIEL